MDKYISVTTNFGCHYSNSYCIVKNNNLQNAYFDRVVYYLHDFEQLKSIRRSRNEIVRVVFVVTESFTEDLINRIAVYCRNSDDIDELSFQQIVEGHYQETDYYREYLRERHQKL